MANPSEILQIDPTIERRGADPGRVEADDFVINDIPLRIPPSQIQVTKESFNNEWQTLRTVSSQKMKSGHSIARVAINVIFEDIDDINNKLRLIVAGLRATPICVVYNPYLENILSKPSENSVISTKDTKYKRFQPIMLVMTSMSFSTMGHRGMPTSIQATFDFLWFNYLPFTPLIAFKSGPDFSQPGLAWQSPLWKQFYSPFLKDTWPIQWGIQKSNDKDPNILTLLKWKEFLMVPKGTSLSNRAAIDLAETLKTNPEGTISRLHSIVKNAQPDQINSQGIMDLLYRRLVKDGLTNNVDIKSKIDSIPAGAITEAAGDQLTPIIQKISKYVDKTGSSNTASAVFEQINNIDATILTLNKRADELDLISKDVEVNSALSSDSNYKKLIDIDASFKVASQPNPIGGLTVYARKREFPINPKEGEVIEQINIQFTNIIAMIPMCGYRYPTFQHIGSIDARVTMVINTTNRTAGYLNKIYDTYEDMALRFKQIPQGFNNLIIENDFLRLFGLSEFLTTSLSTETIPEQPGRSQLVLELVQAGLNKKSKISEPDQLKQEFVVGDDAIYKAVWQVLQKYLQEEGLKAGKNPTNGYERYKYEIYNLAFDIRTKIFRDLLDAARDNYNAFLKLLHKKIFSSNPIEGKELSGHFLNLSENTEGIGFFPGIDYLQRSLQKRDNFNRQNSEFGGSSLGRTKTVKAVQEGIKATEIRKKFLSRVDPTVDTGTITNVTNKEILDRRIIAFQDAGLFTYLTAQKILFDKIISNHLSLDQFKHLVSLKEKQGLDKGLMAYPDFKPQIASVAGYVENTSIVTDGDLLKYDPDLYFWYPAVHGGEVNQAIDSIIDPYLFNEAKKISTKSFESVQENVSRFFQDKYIPMLKDSIWDGPFKKLEASTLQDNRTNKSLSLATPFYKDLEISNSLRGESIAKTVTADPNEKISTNFYLDENGKPKAGIPITAPNEIKFKTNIFDQWEGSVNSTGSNSSPSPIGQDDKLDINISPASMPRLGNVLGLKSFQVNWPRPSSMQKPVFKDGQKFLCPLAFYDRIAHLPDVLHVRDISKNIKNYRNAVKSDWETGRAELIRAGYTYDPAKAEKDMGIPLNKWTINTYKEWQSGGSNRKLGRIHKGMDIFTPLGTDVYAACDGTIRVIAAQNLGAGLFIDIAHNNPYVSYTRYMHLQEINPSLRVGQFVEAGTCIGVAGETGTLRGGVHLHFEVRKGNARGIAINPLQTPIPWNPRANAAANTQRFVPGETSSNRLRQLMTKNQKTDVTSSIVSPFERAMDEFTKEMLRGQGQSMMRAYPTFKLYFIEDDSGERKRLSFDDFFSYNAVKSIRIHRSRKLAADLCELYLTNISGTLSNRKFSQARDSSKPRDAQGKIVEETINSAFAQTIKENPIASLLLQEGTQIQVRLGYCTDPDRLTTVFNGKIMEIEFSESEDLIRILAQSHAIELIQDIKGLEKPQTKTSLGLFGWDFWGFAQNASTGRILEEMLAEPEVQHFGRWTPTGGGNTPNRDLLTNRWKFYPQPADDNIFAPKFSEDLGLADGVVFNNLKYVIYRTTIWDIFKEMELRHPNFISLPVPYEDKGRSPRMTMFFGLPNQLYFARHPNDEEQSMQDRLQKAQREVENKFLDDAVNTHLSKGILAETIRETSRLQIAGAHPAVQQWFTKTAAKGLVASTPIAQMVQNVIRNFFKEVRLDEAKSSGYIQPFRKYHLLTSSQHIISNNIRANSRDVANTIAIKYPKDAIEVSSLTGQVSVKNEEQIFTLKLDNALPPEEIRTQIGQFINVTNEELAKRYALGLLIRNLREIYKGYLCIIGNPEIKPCDICYVFDQYTEMVGPVEVEEVIHTFSQESGFRTEIKPDMMVVANEWSLLSGAEAMGVVMEGAMHKLFKGNSSGIGNAGQDSFSPWAFMMGYSSYLFGGFLANKILNFTQLAYPVVMVPLTHHGRIFAGGVPTRKIPTSIWTTIFGHWEASIDTGFNNWYEDSKDSIIGWIKKNLGVYSEGDFFNND